MKGYGEFFILLPFILIIVIKYALLDRDTISHYDGEYPMQFLERRYNNDEIGTEEYFRMKRDMGK